MGYKQHTNCRVCGSDKLTQYLDLGMMPLSNNLCDTAHENPQRYPLKVLLCEDCGLSQLSIVVFPETMFSNYSYRSGISQGYRDHCRQMAKDLGVKAGDFVIDIAGNDGTLLHEFQKLTGRKGLNVDPAENLVPVNEANGVRQFTKFWGYEAAQHLQATGWPKANFITATNVFAHVDDVKEFLDAASNVLAPDGVIVLEFPYLVDFIEKNEFDTVYFEHLSYFAINPIFTLCDGLNLCVDKVTRHNIHGGSVRVEIRKGEKLYTQQAYDFAADECDNGYFRLSTYEQWATRVRDIIFQFRAGLTALKAQGARVAAFAASAKGNTLLNAAGVTFPTIEYIIDQTPEKIGKYSPGTHIPIVAPGAWDVDYIVILSWNFAEEIKTKCRAAGYTGKFILPLTFEICE